MNDGIKKYSEENKRLEGYSPSADLDTYQLQPEENDYLKDGLDYYYRRDFTIPKIVISKEEDYDPRSETSFNKSEKQTKTVLKLIFQSSDEVTANQNNNRSYNKPKKDATKSIYLEEIRNKYDDIRQNLLSSAKETSLNEYKMKLNDYKLEKSFDEYLGESIKDLDSNAINQLKMIYKKLYLNNDISEEEYKMKLEELNNNIINLNLLYSDEKYSKLVETYNKSVITTLANNEKYKNKINSINKYINDYSRIKKEKALEEASDNAERFLKYFGGFL